MGSHFQMICSLLLLSTIISAALAADRVKVRPYFDSQDKCATWLDANLFDPNLYKTHFNSYYNGGQNANEEEIVHYDAHVSGRAKRDMYKTVKLWPNATIPYLISCDYTESEKVFLANAMRSFEERTCIRFVPFEGKEDNFLFADPAPDNTECSATMGKSAWGITYQGKPMQYSKFNIKRSCFKKVKGTGTVTHELMHVLGFYHQHERFDATPSVANAVKEEESVTYGPFDYSSAAGYRATRMLTDMDVLKINRAYQCKKTTRGGKTIDLSKVASVRQTKGKIGKVSIDCPFGASALTNVALITIDVQGKKANYTNILEPLLAECEINSKCILPFVYISSTGQLSYNQYSSDYWFYDNSDKCRSINVSDNYMPSLIPGKSTHKCRFIIQRAGGINYCIVTPF